ncbi:MAG: hypothetical protein INQ03_14815 [Candidatus Heimdallarchaeota archaeon]|nr:hypothetical protein [Candidatus Heimdallarchaeota archaeon]
MTKSLRIIQSVVLLFLIIQPIHSVQRTQALLIDIPNDKIQINIPRSVTINFWGYQTEYSVLYRKILDHLPDTMVTEVKLHEDLNSSTASYVIEHYAHSLITQYRYTTVNNPNGTDGYQYLYDELSKVATKAINVGRYNDTFYDGWVIPMTSIQNLLQPFNEENRTTIHILDFSQINDLVVAGSKHWYRLGTTPSITLPSEDMRNLGYVGDNGIFYDPTAIAPYFDQMSYNASESIDIRSEYIADQLSLILESQIAGTPKAVANQLAAEIDLEFAQISVVGLFDAPVTNMVNRYKQTDYFTAAMDDLLEFCRVTTQGKQVEIQNFAEISEYLDSKSETIGNETRIVVNGEFAEKMKYLIRSNTDLYPKYPQNYFYPIFIMADEDRRYIYEFEEGFYDNYEVGLIGFSLLNVMDWNTNLVNNRLLQEQLRVVGNMLGLPTLKGMVAQLESPMSSYGVTAGWDKKFTEMERNTMALRYSAIINASLNNQIDTMRFSILEPSFSWVNTSGLDSVQELLRKGDEYMLKGQFYEAVEKHVEAKELWEEVEEEIFYSIKAAKNSIYFGSFMLFFVFIIFSLQRYAIPLKKYTEKYGIKSKKSMD